MKVSCLAPLVALFLAGSANAFTVSFPSRSTTATAPRSAPLMRAATVDPTSQNGKFEGHGKKYAGSDGSTILGNSQVLATEIFLIAPIVTALHPGVLDLSDVYGALGAGFHVFLAFWVGTQANRVRCVFDKQAVEFYNLKGTAPNYIEKKVQPSNIEGLTRKPNNWLVSGTTNRWNYKTITSYRFYPSIEFPVICILWEDQTGEGKISYGSQPHFFPLLFSAKSFKQEMDKRGVPYKFPVGN